MSASFLPQAILSSSKDSKSHKDDGLFKAPPPPPKVIKSETIPTRLNQDIVTALKCRKEHKEVSLEHTEIFFGIWGEEAKQNLYLYSLFTTFVVFCYELIFRIQPSCFNSFDADYTVTGVEFF